MIDITKEELDHFDIEKKHGLIWKLNDLSKQIESIRKAKDMGKTKMDNVDIGPQNIDGILYLQTIKANFLYHTIGYDDKGIKELNKELKEEMCESYNGKDLCCKKHFLTWSKVRLLDEYGSK